MGKITKNHEHELYGVYYSMLQRCYNPRTINYKYYGGSGVTVCKRWQGKNGFNNFLKDMGERPEGRTTKGYPKYSIDRINCKGDYEPSNCKWATLTQQAINKTYPNGYCAGGYNNYRLSSKKVIKIKESLLANN